MLNLDVALLTENTEVRTESGWVPISKIELGQGVLCTDPKGTIVRDQAYNIGVCDFDGVITRYVYKDAEIYGKSIELDLPYFLTEALRYTEDLVYSGLLYSIITHNNTLICRAVKEYSPLEDYIVIKAKNERLQDSIK